MSNELSAITRDALKLSPAQRRTLARILLETSEDDKEFSPDVDRDWEDEIIRRLHAVESGTARSRNVDDVFADLDRRFGR